MKYKYKIGQRVILLRARFGIPPEEAGQVCILEHLGYGGRCCIIFMVESGYCWSTVFEDLMPCSLPGEQLLFSFMEEEL